MAELIWDGKYKTGPHGQQVKQGPLRVTLPFQTVETVNESAQERQKNLFATDGDQDWRNRLIWGDKRYVLPSLSQEFAGKVDLIYIDPPFNTGGDFTFSREIPDSSESFDYKPNAIEQKAYRDTWGRGLDSYLKWFYETSMCLKELLSPTGSIYVHLDDNVSHYAKVILDEVFGAASFRNHLVWQRTSAHNDTHRYGMNFDSLLFYSATTHFTWNVGYHEYSEAQKARYKPDEDGRLFADFDLTARGIRRGSSGQVWRGYDPNTKGNHWKYAIETLESMDAEGRIYWPKTGGFPRQKIYYDEAKGVPFQSVWTDIFPVNSQAQERVSYATQKPESLLSRIVTTSSNEGDLVLDCFCGSGTTAAVAEKLRRRWIACDLGRFAVHTTRKRLLSIDGLRPFVVQNLGKYERQQWQAQEFGEDAEVKLRAYRTFILELYKGRELRGKSWIHGVKGGRMIHVGSVDSPISLGDVQQIAKEFKQSIGSGSDAPTTSGIDVLGWDFAFDLNETARNTAKQAGIDMRFVVIPREVLEKKAVEQGDIHFYELAALTVDTKLVKRRLYIELIDFMMSLEDVPQDVQDAIKHWSQWIDYWAIDFDYRGDTFHNQEQSFRKKREPKLNLKHEHQYEEPGSYTVMVKVIDILGNDTTKTVKVEVK